MKPNPRVEPQAIRKPVNLGSVPLSSSDDKWLAAVKQKTVTHTQHAWKVSAISTGWSSRSPPLYNNTEEMVIGEGPDRYVYTGTTATPHPSRELFDTKTTRNNSDSRQSVQVLHASSSDEGPMKHASQGTTIKPIPSEEILETSTLRENKEQLLQCPCVTGLENRLQCQPGDALTSPSPFSELQELFMEKCDNDLCASTSSKQKGTDTESMESSEVTVKFEKSLTNHPAESPTWRGKFNVTSNVSSFGFYGEIVAHPPSKVHRKVYELSKQLPKMIQFELLPRLSLWEKLFDKDIPGPTDIGLYFLPLKSCEEMYFSLVERLNECDMILKSSINGVKLLIFTSKNLQDGSQQIDQRYFLWGVFFSCDDQTCLMVEDMEVDMIGGREMDNVDHVVVKLVQPMPDITPEFSLVKVKKEIPSLGLCSLIEHEMSFERELQRSFDRFGATYVKGKGAVQFVMLENTD